MALRSDVEGYEGDPTGSFTSELGGLTYEGDPTGVEAPSVDTPSLNTRASFLGFQAPTSIQNALDMLGVQAPTSIQNALDMYGPVGTLTDPAKSMAAIAAHSLPGPAAVGIVGGQAIGWLADQISNWSEGVHAANVAGYEAGKEGYGVGSIEGNNYSVGPGFFGGRAITGNVPTGFTVDDHDKEVAAQQAVEDAIGSGGVDQSGKGGIGGLSAEQGMGWASGIEGDAPGDEGFGDAAGGWGEGYWAQGGAVGFNQGGITDTEIIRRFYEKEKNRLRQQEIMQRRYAELEPEKRLFSENRIPGGRTGSSKAVIPPGFFNRIPVGIELLQNYQRQQLTAYPDEVMKRYNLEQQKMRDNKRTVLKGIFNISNADKFMTDQLIKPEQLRASLIKAEQETTDNFARKFKNVQNSLGLGTTFTLSPDDLNARVNLDYTTGPNYRNFSGNVGIPLSDDTTVNVGAQRNLIEGGQDSTAYGAGLNTKLFDGVGSLGFNLRKNPGETYGGIKFEKRF